MNDEALAAWLAIATAQLSEASAARLRTEIQAHFESACEDAKAAGSTTEAAGRSALASLGEPSAVNRRYREDASESSRAQLPLGSRRRKLRLAMALWELRYATRRILRTPGFAAAFVVTLGLGIGANTAIFSLINGVVLNPLPHQESDQLVYLRQSAQLAGMDNVLFSVPEIGDIRTRTTALAGVAENSTMTFTLLGLDEPRQVRVGIITGNYFDVMGLGPVAGRAIDIGDDGEGAAPVMMLTHGFWGRVFGFDPDVVGRSYEMNGLSVEIVGVLTPSPPYPERTDLFVNMVASPHHLGATMTQDRLHRMTEVFARLAPDATIETARAEVSALSASLRNEYPEAYNETMG
jgi:hypothetical protein